MAIEQIFCAGGNRKFGQLALDNGFLYGSQLPGYPYFPLHFADQDWKKPNRGLYMKALEKEQPEWATVLDLERPEQYREVMEWADEAASLVKVGVIIIPKFVGAIVDLPREIQGKRVRLGYSVPTKFGKTDVPVEDFMDWPVHLLGGHPYNQWALSQRLWVESIDNNYIQKMAVRNCFFSNVPLKRCSNPRFPMLKEVLNHHKKPNAPYWALNLSFLNLKAMWEGAPYGVRYGMPSEGAEYIRYFPDGRKEYVYA